MFQLAAEAATPFTQPLLPRCPLLVLPSRLIAHARVGAQEVHDTLKVLHL